MPTLDVPELPAPVAVELDPTSTALLVLDITDTICGGNPACRATLPAIQSLLRNAREAGARVIFSLARAPQQLLPELEARPEEPVVRSIADKFFETDLADHLRETRTVVVVGTAANGAVLYTSFGACARGLTVVVAEDGISSRDPLATWLARYQLLNQPGLMNPTNTPLAPRAVTLSRSDLIRFAV